MIERIVNPAEGVALATTRYDRELVVRRCKDGRLYEVRMLGGCGHMPKCLQGRFLTIQDAADAIANYRWSKPLPQFRKRPLTELFEAQAAARKAKREARSG